MSKNSAAVEGVSRRTMMKGSITTAGALGLLSGVGSGTARASHLDAGGLPGGLTTTHATQLATHIIKLTASGAEPHDLFGMTVSVSDDGNTALIGARNNDDTGAAYAYDLTTNPPTETKLTANDDRVVEKFGQSVSISGGGDTALIGATSGNPWRLDDESAAYVYDLSQSPPTQTKLTASDATGYRSFGWSVSISADSTTALVGAPLDTPVGIDPGSAYIYDLTTNPPTETKLTPSDTTGGFSFGWSVSISADSTTALVGTRSESAYLYDLTTNPPTETKLTASDELVNNQFGRSVSIDGDGKTALIGTSSGHETAAYVYDLTTNPPTETKLITSDTITYGTFPVSVSTDGKTALIGAAGDGEYGTRAGAAYIYDLTTNPPTETKLTASDPDFLDEFGLSVSMSGNGNTALVGVPYDDDDGWNSGSAYVFVAVGPVTSDVVVSPNPVVAGAPFDITATVECSPTNGASIASAEYAIRDETGTVVTTGSLRTLDGTFDEGSEDVTATVSGLPSGAYDVCVSGTDTNGNEGEEACVSLDVHAPTNSFVTGGGWIDSAPGDYVIDPSVTGKANFGFVAKYKKGANTSVGRINFRFKAGRISFKSRTVQGLTVTGNQTQITGTGKLNGARGYRFTLTASDGGRANPPEPDEFHLTIWNPQNVIVYDNTTSTELGGGNVSVKTR